MKKEIIIIFTVFLILTGCTKTAVNNPSEEENINLCKDFPSVKTIQVNNDALEISFAGPGANMIGRKSSLGIFESAKLSENKTSYLVKKGENIYWGDGDHATQYLIVKDIKDKKAYLTYTDEFYWNGETETKTEECVIK